MDKEDLLYGLGFGLEIVGIALAIIFPMGEWASSGAIDIIGFRCMIIGVVICLAAIACFVLSEHYANTSS